MPSETPPSPPSSSPGYTARASVILITTSISHLNIGVFVLLKKRKRNLKVEEKVKNG
jgi:hypothetical protein